MATDDALDSRAATIRDALVETRAVERLWAGDHTLWQESPAEVADRIGWRHEPEAAIADARTVLAWRDELAAEGITRVVWCGMGGSSLFPELIARAPLPRDPALDLTVLDTVHPAAVRRVTNAHDPASTAYVFASKSGGTIETRTQLDHFAAVASSGTFAVVTDAGSALDQLASQRGWRVWTANPNIGGRFSAFSRFGTVATALCGVDPTLLASAALDFAAGARHDQDNAALDLAVFVAANAAEGRDKLTLVTPPTLLGLGAWVEQLVAESTGKHGAGILPVVDESLGTPDVYGPDRCFVAYGEVAGVGAIREAGFPVLDLGPAAAGALGGELMRWMLATALLGAALRVNPFDQPDVETAKREALTYLDGRPASRPEAGDPTALLDQLGAGDHIVIQAFVDPAAPAAPELGDLRVRLRSRLRRAVTVGIGPRYLHSTGQLYKGGPNSAVVFQIVDDVTGTSEDLAIAGRDYTFGQLLRAQADGDLAALHRCGRRAIRTDLATLQSLA